ncbi:hypothetical protein GCM10009838_20450 [Catenulispora subtropica]|uniref:Uncharacterized protein n=1 Tax=Catenulispora subtropica TaxID=450798 RepID=A0ABN2R467_9ACTN
MTFVGGVLPHPADIAKGPARKNFLAGPFFSRGTCCSHADWMTRNANRAVPATSAYRCPVPAFAAAAPNSQPYLAAMYIRVACRRTSTKVRDARSRELPDRPGIRHI